MSVSFRPNHLLGLVALTGILTACGGGAENNVPRTPEWTAEEELRIGSIDDPDYSLTFFRSMEVAPDGAMYTLHPQDQIVRVFEPDGTYRETIGRRGNGPGEFQNVVDLGWVADTLWVLDANGYRFSQFAADGTYHGSFSVSFDIAAGPRASGLLGDGSVHGATPAFSRLVQSGELTHYEPMLLTREGTVVDSLPKIPFGRNQWAVSDPENARSGSMYMQQPYADGPLWSFVPDERALVLVDREAPTDPTTSTFRVSKVTFTGDTIFTRDYPFVPTPVRAADVDSILDDLGARMEDMTFFDVTAAQGRTWGEESLYQPEYRPGVTDLTVGRDGTIWLSLGPGEPSLDDWLAIDADGAPLGRFSLPMGTKVLLVDPPLLWGFTTDDLDVPYLHRFRIHPS